MTNNSFEPNPYVQCNPPNSVLIRLAFQKLSLYPKERNAIRYRYLIFFFVCPTWLVIWQPAEEKWAMKSACFLLKPSVMLKSHPII